MTNKELEKALQNIHKISNNLMSKTNFDTSDIFRLANCMSILCEVVAATNQIQLPTEE